jgi:hypothetical protein
MTKMRKSGVGAVGAGVEVESGELYVVTSIVTNVVPNFIANSVADFLDGGSDDGGGILGVAEFEVHAAADVLELEHGAAPGRTGDGDQHGLGTKLRMSGDESIASAQEHGDVAVVQGLNLEDGGGREVAEKDAAFDLRADNAAVDFVRQIGVGAKHTNDWE